MPYYPAKDDKTNRYRYDAAKKAVQELVEIKAYMGHDNEAAHGAADRVLTKLLSALDLDDVVEAWEAVEKWYA